MARPPPTATRVNGELETQTKLEIQNTAVMGGVFRRLLPAARGLGPGHPAIHGLSEEERRTVELATERMTEVIQNTPTGGVGLREFSEAQWEVNGDNMEDEFREVEKRTFSDGVHWGRIIAFLAFSVSFAAYVSSLGISGGVGSVLAWTSRVLNTTLLEFIKTENGWNGFMQYSDTLLKAQEKAHRRRNGEVDPQAPPGVWGSVATYGVSIGAIGFGALLAIGVRQAFS